MDGRRLLDYLCRRCCKRLNSAPSHCRTPSRRRCWGLWEKRDRCPCRCSSASSVSWPEPEEQSGFQGCFFIRPSIWYRMLGIIYSKILTDIIYHSDINCIFLDLQYVVLGHKSVRTIFHVTKDLCEVTRKKKMNCLRGWSEIIVGKKHWLRKLCKT